MDKTLQVDLTWLHLLVGVIIPVLVGMVTKYKTSSQFKAYANLVLSAIGGALVTVIGNKGALVPKEFFAGILTVLVTSWASYAGFYKKSTITDTLQQATANFGIGKAVVEQPSGPFSNDEQEAIKTLVQGMLPTPKPAKKAAPKA